jgi:hypothetical protein
VVSTVAPKVTSTCSEGAKPRQDRVARDPAGPLVGDRAQVALVGLATVVVMVAAVPAVVRVAAVVGWAVGAEDGAEDAGAAVWSALPELQPVTARAATTTRVAMIRTGRMMTPPNKHDPECPGHQPRLGRSQHGHRWASRHARTGLDPVATLLPAKPVAHSQLVAGGKQRPLPGTGADKPAPRLEPRAPIARWVLRTVPLYVKVVDAGAWVWCATLGSTPKLAVARFSKAATRRTRLE